MRLWSLHPKYLDRPRILGLWREGLLAMHVLAGRTVGYKKHSQLERFKDRKNPLADIRFYLEVVHSEARARKYNCQIEHINKIVPQMRMPVPMPVTQGQVEYERKHLIRKTGVELPESLELHPLFYVVPGDVEPWERVKPVDELFYLKEV